ncbi:FecR family protein [Bradyrhizobium sp. Mp27]|uniref:FecR family protein n=1 Tax=Bradyrhizobium sp. Mp27 TaxID=3042157 RepID=UPI00248C0E67|nr:FecR family protein [Bradyrhizobium sp. Mp27]MDI2075417.1 FecR family protein [Bradyrhizobium sp. Mp27]
MLGRVGMRCAFVAALILGTASGASAADDGVWSVSKSSGEVWLAANGAQPVSLTQEGTLKAGDTIRTGRNGRVLLVRGEESILISPNSVVGLPAEKKEGLSTTIIQQAGSILLEVEKRNVKHFEVETPYLAAVVKGTQFSVTVNAGSTKVGVIRGQVEVSDFKSGQIAQVMPGQAATSFEHGKPRASTIERVPVPKSGLSAPRNAANGHAIHALGPIDKGTKAAGAPAQSHQSAGGQAPKGGVVRISSSLGEVKLNVHKVTNGLAHGAVTTGHVRNANASTGTETVWSEAKASTTTTAANSSNVTAVTVSSSAPTASATSTSSNTTTTVATTAGSTSDVSGGSSGSGSNGTGTTSNGSGGTGNNGNNGNGNSGSGNNGNNGNGNHGHHYGWYWGRGHR